MEGPNAEVVAHLKLDTAAADGLVSFTDQETIEAREQDLATVSSSPSAEMFQRDCEQLASAWNLRQRREAEQLIVSGDIDPHAVVSGAEICVSQLGGTGVIWPAGETSIQIRCDQNVDTAFLTIIVRREQEERRWVQIAPISGFDRNKRDRAVIGQYLDRKAFVNWLRSLLDATEVDGGGPWYEAPSSDHKKKRTKKAAEFEASTLSLEQILRTYLRDPELLERVDRLIREYLDHIQASSEELDANLQDLNTIWPVVRRQLLASTARAER
jgi:hypothetical protein